MIPRFTSLRDWLDFCRQETVPMSAADWQDPEHVDEVQAAALALMRALDCHDNAAGLINLWLAHRGAHWRLLPVVGRRTRPKEDVP